MYIPVSLSNWLSGSILDKILYFKKLLLESKNIIELFQDFSSLTG
jgi:hypothetical protein